jgi:kinesin family protein 18/19
VLEDVLTGRNCSVFAYGATSAGKTHTMLGHNEDVGIIGLTVQELFARIQNRAEHTVCEIAVTYLEVYNECLRDLLNPESGYLQLRDDGNQGARPTR